jgi:hypothetical protein
LVGSRCWLDGRTFGSTSLFDFGGGGGFFFCLGGVPNKHFHYLLGMFCWVQLYLLNELR